MAFKKIRLKLARYFLKGDHRKTAVRGFSFRDAQSFLVVYDATDKEELELIHKFIHYLKESGKKVFSVGYFDLKEIPPQNKPTVNNQYIGRKGQSWLFKPLVDASVEGMLKQKTDILICINLRDLFPLYYLSAYSDASFKVGHFNPDYERLFDFMIDTQKENNVKSYLRNVDQYLNQIQFH